MALGERQTEDLNKSILAYLKGAGFTEAHDAFATATGLTPDAKHETMLVKKWRAVVRLQKKIFTLESEISSLQEDVANFGRGKKKDPSDSLPREPVKHTLSGHRDIITCVAFHPTFNILATSSADSTIKIWDHEEGKFERSLTGHQDTVQDLSFSANGTFLASCSADLSIKIWDFDTFDCIKTLHGHDHNVSSVSWMPDGGSLVSCSRDKTIKLWDASTGFCSRTYEGHDLWVRTVTVSPNGLLIASCSNDQTIRVWVAKTGECVNVLRDHSHVVETVAFSNAKSDECIGKVIETERKDPGATQSFMDVGTSKAPEADVAKLEAMLQDVKDGGRYLVSGSRDRTIKIWDVLSGLCIKTMEGHDNWVRSVIWHPAGRYVISSSDDKSIRAWDLTRNGRQAKNIQHAHKLFVTTIAWNNSYPLLASGGVDNEVNLWLCR